MLRRNRSYSLLSLACVASLLLSAMPVPIASAQPAASRPSSARMPESSTPLEQPHRRPATDERAPEARSDLPAAPPAPAPISAGTDDPAGRWEPLPSSPAAPSAAAPHPRPALPRPDAAASRRPSAVRATPLDVPASPLDPLPSEEPAEEPTAELAARSSSPADRHQEPSTSPVQGASPGEQPEKIAAPRPPERPTPSSPPSPSLSSLPSPHSPLSSRSSLSSEIFLPLVARNHDPAVIGPRGGTYASPDEQARVAFPPGAVDEGVRVHYQAQERARPPGFVAQAGFFSLEARTAADGTAVETFDAPLEIRVRYDDGGLPTWLEQRLHLYYYDESAGRWERLPSAADADANLVTAWTTHFTDFALLAANASGNPCDQKVQIAEATEPGESYSNVTAFDYYTGTEVSLTCAAADGDVNLEASGPGGSASDSWTFDGGVDEEVTDLFYAPIPGEPAEHDVAIDVQNDPPPGTGSSAFYLEMKDTTPPEIRNVNIWQDGEGGIYVEAQVVDNCAVGSVLLIYGSSSGDGGATGMGNLGGDSYGAAVTLPRVGLNSYTIVAVDMAGNASTWGTSMQASYSGAFGWNVFKDGCPPGACGSEGEPVNTASGNFTYHTEDLRVPGVGETDIAIERGYNSQSVPPQGDFETPGMVPGPFGSGWTFPFDFHLEFVDNLRLSGVKVHYPDGRTARFEDNGDGTFTALSPGVYDTLTESDGGYVLEKKNLTEYHFDDAGRLVQIVDPNGNTVDLTHDADGRPVRVENSAGRWIELEYNAEGLISDIYAPESVHLTYTYTDSLLTSFTDARGQTWGYTYSPEGWLTSIVTPKGHPSLRLRYGEDQEKEDFGRVVEQIEGVAAARIFSYDDAAHTRTILDANGNRTTHRYDADYRLVEVTDARGHSESYDYDDQDRRVYFQDEEGREWHYEYDERGNLIHEDGPLGWERAWTYNQQDRLIVERDPLSRTTRYGYDQFGNPTVVTNALGLTSTTTYDQRGLPVRVTDFAGHAISNTYDLQGDLVAVENGVGAVTRYAHDGLGRTAAMTNPRGFVYTHTYAGGSRLMSALYGPLGYHERYEYDPNGNLVEEVDPNGHATTYTYDESENLVAETDPLFHTTVYTYGPMDHLVAMEDAEGRVTTYQYDAVYNLSAEHAPENATTRYEYDGVGNLVAETDPEGRVTRYVYDALDRMVEQVRNYRPGEPPGPDVNVTTHYEYDLAGNLVQVTSPPDGAHVSRLTFYEYDALDRMVAEVRNYRPGQPAGPDVNVTTRYAYDPNGNLIEQVNPRGYTTTRRYDAADRLIAVTDALSQTTTYAYDPNGNLLQVTDHASRFTSTTPWIGG